MIYMLNVFLNVNPFKWLESLRKYHHLEKTLNYLKHKHKEMRINDLILRLRIEDDNKLSKKRNNSFGAPKANIIER
jgi:hypothetical protein